MAETMEAPAKRKRKRDARAVPMPLEPLFVPIEDAAARLSVSVSTVEKLIREGELTARKLSDSCSRIRFTDLVAWADSRPISDIKPGPGRKAAPQPETSAA